MCFRLISFNVRLSSNFLRISIDIIPHSTWVYFVMRYRLISFNVRLGCYRLISYLLLYQSMNKEKDCDIKYVTCPFKVKCMQSYCDIREVSLIRSSKCSCYQRRSTNEICTVYLVSENVFFPKTEISE
jgi:hypothetical protein